MSTPSDVDFITFDYINPDTDKPAVIPLEIHPQVRAKGNKDLWVVQLDHLRKVDKKTGAPIFRKGLANANHLGGKKAKYFAITLNDHPIVNTLRDKEFGFKISNDPKQRFKDVVLAFNDIENQTGRMAGKKSYDLEKPEGDPYFVEGFGSIPTRLKILDMGASLFGRRKKRSRQTRSTSKLQLDKKEFEAIQPVGKWLEDSDHVEDTKGKYTTALRNALYILDMSPDEILQGNPDDPTTHKADDEFNMVSFRSWVKTLVNTPSWIDENGKKWTLEDWSMAPLGERVDIAGAGNEQSKQGQKITYKDKAKTARKGTKQTRQRMMTALKHFLGYHGRVPSGRSVGTIFEKPTPILNYPALRMTSKQLERLESCLAKPEGDPQFAEQDKADGKIRFTQKSYYQTEKGDVDEGTGEYVPHEKEGEKKLLTFETTREDWEDAELFFRIALETGWRAYEGLTMTVSYENEIMLDEDDDLNTAVYNEPVIIGEIEAPEGIMVMKFLTRKTWHVGRFTTDQYIGLVNNPCRIMINAKLDKIKQGIAKYNQKGWDDEKILETYGVAHYSYIDGKKEINHNHALIGSDGKYIKVGTYKFPTSQNLTATAKAKLPKDHTPREFQRTTKDGKEVVNTLQAIIRHCIIKSEVDLNQMWMSKKLGKKINIGKYWLTNTMHSLRHVFAQYWLWKSNNNFSFVATKGHWAGTKILEEAYGGSDANETLTQNIFFGDQDLAKIEKDKAKAMSQTLKNLLEAQKTAPKETHL